jgi:hypothetical protein
MNYDDWKTGFGDGNFEDAPEWPPCYRDKKGYPRDTDTGRFLSEDEYAKVREEWESGMEPEEIEEADEQLEWDKFRAAQDRKRRAARAKEGHLRVMSSLNMAESQQIAFLNAPLNLEGVEA